MTAYIDLRGKILLYSKKEYVDNPRQVYIIKIPLHALMAESELCISDTNYNRYVNVLYKIYKSGTYHFSIHCSHDLHIPKLINPEFVETVNIVIPGIMIELIKNYERPVRNFDGSVYNSIPKSIVEYLSL